MHKFRFIRNWTKCAILVACLVYVTIVVMNRYQYGVYEDGVVKVREAGVLKKLLGDDALNITSLKIVGPISAIDVHFLRQMLGAPHFEEAERGKLASLDLSEASIVKGGYMYFASGQCYATSNDIIGEMMFFDCDNLQHIILPDGVTAIEHRAFGECSSLTSISIPHSVTRLGSGVFSGCSSLVSIEIPSGVTSWEKVNFMGCTSLIYVYCYAPIPPVIEWRGHNPFVDQPTLKVPKGSASAYKESDWRDEFENIVEME